MNETSEPLSLARLNAADVAGFEALLDGIYEHSPWVARAAADERPFASLAHLKFALAKAVRVADVQAQLALIRAHPELAGKAMVARTLTVESTAEQRAAGLTHCTPEQFERLHELNRAYNERFGFPFILAVRGPRGQGLSREAIIETFARRLHDHPDAERAEALRNIHRIAELRLNERFGFVPALGDWVWDEAEALARFSDDGFRERGELTVTYLTAAHRACAERLRQSMRDAGFDQVSIDAVGNVVGVYEGSDPQARRLLTGSHYDTVRNGGRYDGRLGILVPIAAVRWLAGQGRRLPIGIEVVAFSEEEGQRYSVPFLGSGALTGRFDPAWLELTDAEGITLREAMARAGLDPAAIPALRRDAGGYVGFVEVHIEQGPVLSNDDLPLAVVSSICGGVRYRGELIGRASHAGTTPMDARHDAAVGAAEFMLQVEQRAATEPGLVGTVGMLEVPGGSINVVPGRCLFSLDVRAPEDAVRDACERDLLAWLDALCARRGLRLNLRETMRAAAAPCDEAGQRRWADAVRSLGLPVFRMPSGAGHDAMELHKIMPQSMLFVRGLNNGISHNPLESITSDDADLAVRAFCHLAEHFAGDAS
ncbi:MAG: 2-oxo-4-hydroxy-4-carboxy-5-ureidoimidazoline decarboxylase [Burkholderiaceae bacterium]